MAGKSSRPSVVETQPAVSSGATWRRIVPTLVTVLAVTIFVGAGQWQKDRMQQKLALAQQWAVNAKEAAVPLPASLHDWAVWRFRVVEMTGRYDAARQILVDNRVHAGRVGYHVVTPLLLDDGRAVLINRGFVAAGPRRDVLPEALPPPGSVRVHGRVNPAPGRYLELGEPVTKGQVWQNLDPSRFAASSGLPVLPVVVEQIEGPVDAAADGLARNWPRADAGADKHRIYMMQWYAFAALAAGLWAWFTFRRRA